LPKEQRELVHLRYWRELSVQEIAVRVDLNPNHVAQKLRRIRLALFQCLKGKPLS